MKLPLLLVNTPQYFVFIFFKGGVAINA